MNKLLSFEFLFRARQYYALARVKSTEAGDEYQVSVMDKEIERMLKGCITIREKEGNILSEPFSDSEKAQLFQSISQGLIQRKKESEKNADNLN
jgi:hypothetical protein